MNPPPPKTERQQRRCAIYTRVSTDQGLDKGFTSLDAQRDACLAFVASQTHECWQAHSEHFDDGGYSGGNLERPAVQRLLKDIRAGKIDIIVVYKIDRLTRSLTDFARLVDLFEQHRVSFVSVTQAFNTTTSMGRLTLNVLLSFAQFERELASERISDKISASKRRGIRMGGPVPLGYDLVDKKLIPNGIEAEHVRTIFRLYIQRGSLAAVTDELGSFGILTKRSYLKDGRTRGGQSQSKSGVRYILRNRVYLGDLVHKSKNVAAAHPAIIDRETFDAVQARLDASAPKIVSSPAERAEINASFKLTRRLFDANGYPMTPSTTRKNSALYRYYISAPISQGRRLDAVVGTRVSAPKIENVIADAISQNARSASTDLSYRPDNRTHASKFTTQYPIFFKRCKRSSFSRVHLKFTCTLATHPAVHIFKMFHGKRLARPTA